MAEFRHQKAVFSYDDREETLSGRGGETMRIGRLVVLMVAVAVAFVLAATLLSHAAQALNEADKQAELASTLPPEKFEGTARHAYAVAKEIPEVLDQLYCWCHCELNPHFRHKSLLSCYQDEHAASCWVCQQEAIMAYEMHKQRNTSVPRTRGDEPQRKSIDEIRHAVDEQFGNNRPVPRAQ